MLSIVKIKKCLSSHDEFKLIKKANKSGNKVSFKASLNKATIFSGKNEIGESSIKNSQIGFASFIGSGCEMNNCKIGKYCSISSMVKVVEFTHPTNMVSSYPGFYDSSIKRFPFSSTIFDEALKTDSGFSCEIGNDVWIGRNVLIKGGVTIGDGAIIGMGAIVTKDVPSYAIVAGVPAKILRYRFSKEQIERLLSIKWWDWSPDIIETRKSFFSDINAFLNDKNHFHSS